MSRPTAIIIAIDGPSGAGKSTVATRVAQRLGLPYLDTGAMYRAIGLLALRSGMTAPLDSDDVTRLEELCKEDHLMVEATDGVTRVLLDGEDVSDKIRTMACSEMASAVSTVSAVRRALVSLQRRIGRLKGGVMEGRDIGSVVFPGAEIKIFLTASEEERARRRVGDLDDRGIKADFDMVLRQQRDRDHQDSNRKDSPLSVAPGAHKVDSTGMTMDDVIETVLAQVEESLDSTGQDTVRSRNY